MGEQQSSDTKAEQITAEYIFRLEEGHEERFQLEFDKKTLKLIPRQQRDLPEWTRLSFHQCENCPLSLDRHKRCPVAGNIVHLVDVFKKTVSYKEAEIIVQFGDREYRKTTPIQYGVSSLLGLHMVTSGCPVMDKLRPMAFTHLPFASVRETLYRVVSMYLMAQYYIDAEGGDPDWKLENLGNLYENIGVVNRAFHKRLAHLTGSSDSVNNALVNLDCFALLTTIPTAEEHMAELAGFFEAWKNDALKPVTA